MSTIKQMTEGIEAMLYGLEFDNTNNLFGFVNKIIKDDYSNTFVFEENKKVLKCTILSVLTSISRKIIEELKESKYQIHNKSEVKNGEIIDTYFDQKQNKSLDSRLEIYPTNDILLYHNKIQQQTVDFMGKEEVLNVFYQAYLWELSREASLETHHRKNVDALLDLYNDPRYKEVKEISIFPALSDLAAEQILPSDLKFKTIEEATEAYVVDGSLETLAQLKKLHMIKAIKKTENCFDHEALAEMLNGAAFDCVKRIIIRRLAYLDVNDSR